MSLNLKVLIPSRGLQKVMRFAETMSVHEVCKQIQEKTEIGGPDHGLFEPRQGESCGRWLKREKTLEYYDIKSNDTVEYKKRHEPVKVKLVDDSVKTFLVDTSETVSDVMKIIGDKLSLKNVDEFGLQAEKKPGIWFKGNMAIPEQVETMDQLILLKKRFFVNDANVDQDDPVQLHLVYCQCRDDVVSGKHPVSKDEAVLFASLQCQITSADYKPDQHKPGWMADREKEFFQPQWQKTDMEKLVYAEWKKLVGMTDINAKFRYIQLCRSLKTYGMTCFKVRELSRRRRSCSTRCFASLATRSCVWNTSRRRSSRNTASRSLRAGPRRQRPSRWILAATRRIMWWW